MATTTTELRGQVLAALAALEPDSMSPEAAVRAVEDFATMEKAAATGRMFAALRVARSDAWRGQGHASAADWLAAKAGITVREASSQLGTARRANRLPKTKDRMRKGRLSPTQAGAVADAASADPTAEDSLLDAAANDTTANLKDKAAKAKAAATDDATRERRVRAERSVRTRTDADGAFCLFLRGPGADGARIEEMLRPFQERAFLAARSARGVDGVRDTFENRSYDAFMAMLGLHPLAPAPSTGTSASGAPFGTSASADDATSNEGIVSAARDAGAAADGLEAPVQSGSGPGGNNVKVIVRVDHTALMRGHTVAGETCEIAGLGPISVEAARELAHDAFLAAVVTKGRDVLNVAHLGRSLSAHQRTAIEWMGIQCSNRACNKTVAMQVDHRRPWTKRRETKLDNQDPLCPDCHRRKTHHGWHLEPGRGRRRFLPPDVGEDGVPSEPVGGSDPPCPPALDDLDEVGRRRAQPALFASPKVSR